MIRLFRAHTFLLLLLIVLMAISIYLQFKLA